MFFLVCVGELCSNVHVLCICVREPVIVCVCICVLFIVGCVSVTRINLRPCVESFYFFRAPFVPMVYVHYNSPAPMTYSCAFVFPPPIIVGVRILYVPDDSRLRVT